jgi:predicted acylesterase/phospholipase RssA
MTARERGRLGLALAGGGPLGAIYEIGALAALDEVLVGANLCSCDVYVGVSAGAFIAAGLANGMTPADMYRSFIESEMADDPFEPELLLRPALGEYLHRLATTPSLLRHALDRYFEAPFSRGFFESFQQLGRALPTGVFDSSGMGDYLRALYSAPGRSNDFRELTRKLFIVATDLDASEAVAFGAEGNDDVPISRAVMASSALPGLFPPVEIKGRHFVDGALMKTVHASVALKEGVKLLFCVNPLVPFDARIASRRRRNEPASLIDGGLPMVLSQTFRAIVHSRMRVGMDRYARDYPEADVVLFEPSRGDADMFFTNVFSYSSRKRLSEHAYRHTRAQLRERAGELEPILARHGLALDKEALRDEHKTLAHLRSKRRKTRPRTLGRTASQLERALHDLDRLLESARRPA